MGVEDAVDPSFSAARNDWRVFVVEVVSERMEFRLRALVVVVVVVVADVDDHRTAVVSSPL